MSMNLRTLLTTVQSRSSKQPVTRLKHKASVIVPERVLTLFALGRFSIFYGESRHCAWGTEGHEFYFNRRSLKFQYRNNGLGLYREKFVGSYAPEPEPTFRPDTWTPRS